MTWYSFAGYKILVCHGFSRTFKILYFSVSLLACFWMRSLLWFLSLFFCRYRKISLQHHHFFIYVHIHVCTYINIYEYVCIFQVEKTPSKSPFSYLERQALHREGPGDFFPNNLLPLARHTRRFWWVCTIKIQGSSLI